MRTRISFFWNYENYVFRNIRRFSRFIVSEEHLTGLSITSLVTLLEHIFATVALVNIVATVFLIHINSSVTMGIIVAFNIIVAFLIPLVIVLTSSRVKWREEHLWNLCTSKTALFQEAVSFEGMKMKCLVILPYDFVKEVVKVTSRNKMLSTRLSNGAVCIQYHLHN
jgi:hypothetical protein